jgi:YVTN family beta-propeller protein
MKRRQAKTLSVGCILLAVFFYAFTSLPQLAQGASTVTVTVGGTPYAVAITPDGKYAYVPNGENVIVIDTATNKVTATITAQNWPCGIAITPDGKYAYVTDVNSPAGQEGLVSVISTATNTVAATITVGGDPNRGVAVTPNGKYVYVTNVDGAVAVISTATNTITANITIPSLNVANTNLNDTNTAAPPRIITVGGGHSLPQAVAITPNGECAYVATREDRVAVINTTTNTVTAAVTVGGNPNAVAITPNGEYAYVTNDSAVVVINTATNAVTKAITGFYSPICVAIAPDGKYAYVTNYFNDSVSVINTATNTVDWTVNAGTSPYGIAIMPNGEYAYVTNLAYTATQAQSPVVNWVGMVSVISTGTNTAPTGSSTPTPSPSPAVPAFSAQSLTLILLVSIIIVLSAVIVAKRKLWKNRATSTERMLTPSNEKINDKKNAPAETRLVNQAK